MVIAASPIAIRLSHTRSLCFIRPESQRWSTSLPLRQGRECLMETEIRQMKPSDYDILCSAWSDDAGVGLGLGDEREGFERHLRRNPESSFVANHRGRIVGAVLAGHDGRRGYLYHLLVLPEFRGRGLGRAFVK